MMKSLFKIANNNYLQTNLIKNFFATMNFKVSQFNSQDYKTLCMLLQKKFPVYNQEMEILTDIKLFDEKNKLIGVYSPPEARKKVYSMNKDIVLVNDRSNPAICKAVDFRHSTLQSFFTQIITKRNEDLINRASSIKNLKLKPSLNINQVKIKAKQVAELAKKHSKVRIYMILKNTTMDQGLQKFDLLKSLIQNSCRILEQVDVWNRGEQDQQADQELAEVDSTGVKTISMMIKSSTNQFMQLLQQSSKVAPEKAIKNFLKRFYKQQDVEMRDMKNRYQKAKQSHQKQTDNLLDFLGQSNKKQQQRQKQLQRIKQTRNLNNKRKAQKTQEQIQKDKRVLKIPPELKGKHRRYEVLIKQGQQKVISDRLKKLMSIYDSI